MNDSSTIVFEWGFGLERPIAEGAGRNTVGVQPALLGGARELLCVVKDECRMS